MGDGSPRLGSTGVKLTARSGAFRRGRSRRHPEGCRCPSHTWRAMAGWGTNSLGRIGAAASWANRSYFPGWLSLLPAAISSSCAAATRSFRAGPWGRCTLARPSSAARISGSEHLGPTDRGVRVGDCAGSASRGAGVFVIFTHGLSAGTCDLPMRVAGLVDDRQSDNVDRFVPPDIATDCPGRGRP